MLSLDRRQLIKDRLNISGSIKVDELAEELGVTQMTIRRDLDKLEAESFLKRTHGGAVLADRLLDEEEYDTRKEKNIDAKKRIAEKASEMIQDDSTILLDAGTTTYELAQIIKNRKGLVVITGDLKIASLLYKTDNDVHFIGGRIEKKTGTVMSTECLAFIEQVNIDYAFIGGSAISNKYFLTTPTFDKAKLKSKVMETADKSILLVDNSKFGIKSLVKIAHIKEFDTIVTDVTFEESVKEELEEAEVEVIRV